MKYFIFFLVVIPITAVFSQNSCCELMERLRNQKQSFTTKLNEDSTDHYLVVIDTLTRKPIFEYNYKDRSPLLKLDGDSSAKFFRRKKGTNTGSMNLSKDPYSKGPLVETELDYLRRQKSRMTSNYRLIDFDYDTINWQFRNLIEELNFPYCENYLNIIVERRTIYLKRNTLISTVTNRINLESSNYVVIQYIVELVSCRKSITERRLDVINSKGQSYSIIEKYDLNERPKFAQSIYGVGRNDFDVIELDSQFIFITYIGTKIKIYDLHSETLLTEIDSKGIYSSKLKALKLKGNSIIFIPKPIRVGGHDLRNYRGIKANHIDFSRIKDYDDTVTKILVFDLFKNIVYTKKYRIDEIESIQSFEGHKIIFNTGRVDDIEDSFELQELK